MSTQNRTLHIINVTAIVVAFLIAMAPSYAEWLAPYPKACAVLGVAVGVLTNFSRLLKLLRAIVLSGVDGPVPTPPAPPVLPAPSAEQPSAPPLDPAA